MPADSRRRTFFLAALLASIVVLGVVAALSQFMRVDQSIGNVVVKTQRGSSYPVPETQRGSSYPMPETQRMTNVAAASARVLPEQASESDGFMQSGPKNFILVIGDGMGLGQISTASGLLFGPGGGLAQEQAKVLGLTRAWALDSLTVDSASAGSAIATGFRTNNGMVGMLPDGRRVRNLLEAARDRSMATAMVTTSFLMDATPACFTAHTASRKNYSEILEQMLASHTDILIGGNSKIPDDGGQDPVMVRAVAKINKLSDFGYTLVRDEEGLATATGKILGLFPSRNGDPSYHGPPLEVSTRKMLDLLAGRAGGFAAVIESEITDAAGHSNDVAALVEGVRELDAATRVVLDFAENRGDTLVLVLADHATGVPAIVSGKVGSAEAEIRWVTTHHAFHWLPVFAFGPGAEAFAGVYDAAQIGPTIAALMGFEGYPAVISQP